MNKNVMVGGLHVGVLVQDEANFDIVRKQMHRMVKLFSEGKIKPVIDSVYHFEQVRF